MKQKKLIKQLQDEVQSLRRQNNTTEERLRVSHAERDAYKEQNATLEQKMQHFEKDYEEKMQGSSILEYIWDQTRQKAETCIITDLGGHKSEIETRSKIVEATNFVEYMCKMLYSWCYQDLIHDHSPLSQHLCLENLKTAVDFQIIKLQEFNHTQEFILMDRNKSNELMAKFLFVFSYIDVILLISKFGFTDKFYQKFHEKVLGLYLLTPISARQDITEEKLPLSIIYKNLIYQELNGIISKLSNKKSKFAINETSNLMQKLQYKFSYPNKQNVDSSIYHQFQDYIGINNH